MLPGRRSRWAAILFTTAMALGLITYVRLRSDSDVVVALAGTTVRKVRITETGGLLLSVAVPVQRYKQVLGALMLSVDGEDIDAAVR